MILDEKRIIRLLHSPDESVRDDTDANGLGFFFVFDSQVWEKVTRNALADISSISTAFQKLMWGLQRDGAAFHMLEYLGK